MSFSFILYYALCYQLHFCHIGVLGFICIFFPAERSSSPLPVFLFFSPYIYVGPIGGTQLGPASASGQSSDQYATLHLVGMFCRYYPLTYKLTLLLLFGWEWLAIDLCGGNGFQLDYLYFQSFLWIYVYPATTRLIWVCV